MQSCPSILRFRSCNSKTALEARSTHVSIEKKPFESRFAQLPTPSGSVNLSGANTICSCEYYSCWKWSGPAHGCLGCKYPPINWVLYTANYFVASCLQHVCLKPIYFIIETPSTRDSRIFFDDLEHFARYLSYDFGPPEFHPRPVPNSHDRHDFRSPSLVLQIDARHARLSLEGIYCGEKNAHRIIILPQQTKNNHGIAAKRHVIMYVAQ